MSIVFELPANQFWRVQPLFANPAFDEMFINPALDGRQAARVFVDNAEFPRSAMLCRTYEFYLAGDPNPAELRRFIHEAPAEVIDFQHFHGFAPLDPVWISPLESDFEGALMVLPRIYFRWPNNRIASDWHSRLPDQARIVPITADLARRIDTEWGENIGFFWGGYDRYAAHGYGCCLLINDQIASTAVADGCDGHSASIGVVTVPEFRRKGFSELTSTAFIEDSLARGIQPVWECEVRNVASKALAEKLGFIERARFAQLSIAEPPYGPLRLSNGVWHSKAGIDNLTIWQRDD